MDYHVTNSRPGYKCGGRRCEWVSESGRELGECGDVIDAGGWLEVKGPTKTRNRKRNWQGNECEKKKIIIIIEGGEKDEKTKDE